MQDYPVEELDDFRAANGDEVSLAAYAYDGETGEINYAAGYGLYSLLRNNKRRKEILSKYKM